MGREQYILLAGLGLLAGAFFGVLSIKLLSPRPPAGAGADIHDAVAIAAVAETVEPPTLSVLADSRREMAAAPSASRVPSATTPVAHVMRPGADEAFVGALPDDEVASDTGLVQPVPAGDPFARAARFDSAPPSEGVPDDFPSDEPERLDIQTVADAAPLQPLRAEEPPAAMTAASVPVPADPAPRHEVTHYVAATGDSWWSLAERMYGDGRYYRALFAWNRAVNPRVSLVPGTPLQLPPLSKLTVAWPALVPDE
ncbi:MAG: hypothetical protein O3A37_02420 [Planctomycetota bacterium]|nr:hypothetical protein [Planctomycetota bacterium]